MALDYPHIRTLHGVDDQDGVDFLVMDRLEGEGLVTRLATGAWLPRAERGLWAHRDAPTAYR